MFSKLAYKKVIVVALAIIVPIVLVAKPLDFIWADEPVSPPTSAALTAPLTSGDYSLNPGYDSNLEDFEDPETAVGVELILPSVGKIRFTNSLNLANETIREWLQNLDQYLTISQNTITLDTTPVKGLINEQAVLVMHNVDLQSPRILINGQPDSGGVITNVIYDRNTKTLTFTVSHFTTYQAVEGYSSPPAAPKSPSCTDSAPTGSPTLFQIDTNGTQARLYFTPLMDATDRYYVAYGYENGDIRFGTEIPYAVRDGVMVFTISDLELNKKYAFWVRGGHGCMPGDWGNWMEATTSMSGRTFFKN